MRTANAHAECAWLLRRSTAPVLPGVDTLLVGPPRHGPLAQVPSASAVSYGERGIAALGCCPAEGFARVAVVGRSQGARRRVAGCAGGVAVCLPFDTPHARLGRNHAPLAGERHRRRDADATAAGTVGERGSADLARATRRTAAEPPRLADGARVCQRQ